MALSEKQMIGKIQEWLYTRVDFDPGRHTYTCFYTALAKMLGKEIDYPFAVQAFNEWVILADHMEVRPFDPNGQSLVNYPKSVSGSFSYNNAPISIMVSEDEILRPYSCHYWMGKPESVLCVYKDGTYNVQRVKFEWEIENRSNLLWAVGGAGIMNNYAPVEEGFAEIEYNGTTYYFNDVWRDTNHVVIGFDLRGILNIGFLTSCNYDKGLAWCIKVGMDPDNVIWLDGGHITAVNMPEIKYNYTQKQEYGLLLGGN